MANEPVTPVTASLLRAMPLPQHRQGDNKEGRGQVLVVGGCAALPGAILLSAEAALRAGAGKLQVATCGSFAAQLGLAVPEAMVIRLPEADDGSVDQAAGERLAKPAAGADAILVGPGMLPHGHTGSVVAALLDAAEPDAGFVLDAGAMAALPDCLERLLRRTAQPAVITPHAGEMARLMEVSRDAITDDPLAHARQAASRFGCIVLLKGTATHVVEPGGRAWAFEGGTVALGTSGSGDVLAGIIAGLIARGTPAAQAAIWGVFLHAEAGVRLTRRFGGIGLLARELPGEIPSAMADMG